MDSPEAAWGRALLVAVVVALTGLAVGFGLSLLGVVVFVGLGIATSALAILAISLVLTQGVAFGGVALGYLALRGLGRAYIPVRWPTRRDVGWMVGGYLLAFAGAILAVLVVSSVASLFGVQPASNRVAEIGARNPEVLLWLVPFSFLLIGPGEELLFRGVVQGRLRETFGPAAGIALASAIFAAVHFTALSGSVGARFSTILILFLPSLVFGTVYERTRNLVVNAVIHGAYNATIFVILYAALRATGGQPPT